MPASQLNVGQTPQITLPPGIVTQSGGRQGEGLVAELHGKWYTQARDGNVYHALATGLTVPAIASNLVSVFSLLNPAGSTKYLELISADVGVILATTVVDFVGLYFQANIGAGTTLPTSQTAGTAVAAMLGAGGVPQGRFLTAATHVGTPTLAQILATFGATSTTNDAAVHYEFDGKIVVPPAAIVSIAMSTAASTASGLALGLSWAETPL